MNHNDDVPDVDLGHCWHSTDRAADRGDRETAENNAAR